MRGANHVKQRVADRILERLVLTTPVDTSKALSNWQVSSTTPIQDPIEAFFKGRRGSTEMVSTAMTLSVGGRVIRSSQPGAALVISNVVSYIGFLAAGGSPQAPPGWIHQAVVLGLRQGVKEARATGSVI